MFSDVEEKIKRKNKVLFSRDSKVLLELRKLICQQKHLTLVLWAFDCLQIPLSELSSKYPDESRAREAYELSLAWAHGEIKMPVAKRAILDCHAAAKEVEDPVDAALFHAVGQACSTVHVDTHALGLVFYELTAVVMACGYENYQEKVLEKTAFYAERLKWWQDNAETYAAGEKWAEFLTRPGKMNKEKQLFERSI